MIDGVERPLTLWVEYGLFAGLLLFELRRKKINARAWQDGQSPAPVKHILHNETATLRA